MTVDDQIEKLLSDLAFMCAGGITEDGQKEYLPTKSALLSLIAKERIDVLRSAKSILGVDRTSAGVTEDFNAGVEQITYLVNSTLQGNINRMEGELNALSTKQGE